MIWSGVKISVPPRLACISLTLLSASSMVCWVYFTLFLRKKQTCPVTSCSSVSCSTESPNWDVPTINTLKYPSQSHLWSNPLQQSSPSFKVYFWTLNGLSRNLRKECLIRTSESKDIEVTAHRQTLQKQNQRFLKEESTGRQLERIFSDTWMLPVKLLTG